MSRREVIEVLTVGTFMMGLLVLLGLALWMTAIVQGNV
jgi:hypothetical protein